MNCEPDQNYSSNRPNDPDPWLPANGFVEPLDLTREAEVIIELTDGTQIMFYMSEWGNLWVKQPGESK